MPPYAVQITMSTTWHGAEEEFSNVLHYDVPTPSTEAGFTELADNVVAVWKTMFPATVNFKRVRVHGRTDLTKVEDQMQIVKDLTGTGSASAGVAMAPELAIVADVYVGRGPKGGKQFLRKYLHTCAISSITTGGGKETGKVALAAADKTYIIDKLNSLKTVSVGGFGNDICTPTGKKLPVGSTWTVNDFVATRQFRRGRKRKTPA